MQQSYIQRIKDIASNFMDEYLDSPINSLGNIPYKKSEEKDHFKRINERKKNIENEFVVNFTFNINEFCSNQNIVDLKQQNDIIDSISSKIQERWTFANEDQLLINFIGAVNQVKLDLNQDLIKSNIVYKSNNIESVDLLGLEDKSSKSFQDFESFNNPGFDVQGNKIRPKSSPNAKHERM